MDGLTQTNIKVKNRNSKKIISHFSLSFYILIFAFYVFAAKAADAATLYFYPQNLEIFDGENAIVEVRLNTEGEIINALELNGKFSNNNLSITSVDTSSSLLQILVESPQTDGTNFHLVGGTPGGFNGEGIVGRLNIKAVKTGSSILSFTEPVKLLANTENAKELTAKSLQSNLSVILKPKDYIKLSSRTHPEPLMWYNAKEVNIHWDLEPGAEYSYLVSQDQTAVPDETPDRPKGDRLWLGDIALGGLEDGIYYFSVKKIGSTTISRYSIFQDSTPPKWVNVALNPGTPETNGKQYVSFLAKDTTSGIDRYEMKVDDGNFEKVSPPNFIINNPDFQRIIVRAYDEAGNMVEESIETKGGDYSAWIGAAFVVFMMILMFIISQRRKPR